MAVLDSSDVGSRAWLKIKKHYEGRLNKLRIKNDADLDPIETSKLRGRISEVKELLRLGDPPKTTKTDSSESV